MSKLLLEDILESEKEIKEAPANLSTVVKNVRQGLVSSSDDVVNALKTHFGISDDLARKVTSVSGLGRDQALKKMESLLAKELKAGRPLIDGATGKLLNSQARDLSKSIALQDIYLQLANKSNNFTKQLTTSEVTDIINKSINDQLTQVTSSVSNVMNKRIVPKKPLGIS